MNRSAFRRVVLAAGVVAALGVMAAMAGGVLLAQSVISRLGLTDADAGKRFQRVVTSADPSFGLYFLPEGGVGKAYKALPAAARVQVAEGVVAFARTYSTSAAYKAAYARSREEAKPQPTQYNTTVDQELKQKLDEQSKAFEEGTKAALAMLPPDQRAEALAGYKETRAMFTKPEFLQAMRAEIEQKRAQDKAGYESATQKWQETYPADSRAAVARWIRTCLDGTADVDYAATTATANGMLRFTKPEYESKPYAWKLCYRAGKEPVSAARAAMAAWLKEVAPQ